MEIEQKKWTKNNGWEPAAESALDRRAQLVLIFGSRSALGDSGALLQIRKEYPGAKILGCSTAGEIFGTQLLEDSIVATAICFAFTRVEVVKVSLEEVAGDSLRAGAILGQRLNKQDLTHVFILSDGLNCNGSEITRGLAQSLPARVKITGGLAGDGADFVETRVLTDENSPEKNVIAGLGLFGDRISIGYGCFGGWDPFGPERLITRSKDNILYELDGQCALDLYKKYLGPHSAGLPATALLFPLNIRIPQNNTELVRTILGINEKDRSMTFAGDVPEGAYARLMRASQDRLIDGAVKAAKMSYETLGGTLPDLAILISCVGRKLVLRQRTVEEVENVSYILGSKTALTGFYSYGEICPPAPSETSELHNQTMTITTLAER